jgi:molybdenum-dependent DNA-binding transcriptional regulator ModE
MAIGGGGGGGGGGQITNYNQQAMDQQMAVTDQRQAQSTQKQTQLELKKADQNDRANEAKLMTSINDITFGIQKDKMQSANKNSESARSLL